jgi:glycine betaine/proline transport system permease protein
LANGVQQQTGGVLVQYVPPLSWIAVIGIVAVLGIRAGGRSLGLLTTACFTFIAVFGQWHSAMVTLASILVAVPLGVAGGLMFGILAWRHPWFERALRPALDLMQTMPVFAYLVPILILFGFGSTTAVIATLIYATPPMTRITTLALSRVPSAAPDPVAGADPVRARALDGGGQSGDHVVVEHGDHRVDDRGGRLGV